MRHLVEEEPAYIFKHALTQEAAYQSLLVKQRREIHRRVAQAYEAQYGDRCLDEYSAILAQHYAEAGDEEQALVYATRAGDLAARVYANPEAIAFYTQAIQIAMQRPDNTAQLIYLYARRGRAYELAADYVRALENYREMQTLAQARGDRALELESLMLQSTAQAVGLGTRDLSKAQALCEEALALAHELGDWKAEARIYWNLLLVNRFGNEGTHQAIEYGEKSLALARGLNFKEQIALTLKDLAPAYLTVGRTSTARDNLPETLALRRELDNKPMLAEVLGSAFGSYLIAGELEQAVQAGEESLALDRSIGNRYALVLTFSFVWYAYRELGQMERAIGLAGQALALGDELGFVGPQWTAGVELADTFVVLGAFARGEELVKRALATVDLAAGASPSYPSAVLAHLYLRKGDREAAEHVLAPFPFQVQVPVGTGIFFSPYAAFTIFSMYIELALAQGDAERAQAMADDAVTFLNRIQISFVLPSALHLKARALRMLGRTEQAHALLIEACRQAEAMQSRYRLMPILFTLIEMETERGNSSAANEARTRAREIVEYIAAHMPDDVRSSFLNLPEVRAAVAPA